MSQVQPQVVTQQPQSQNLQQKRKWSSGLFGCCDDCGYCMMVTLCPLFADISLLKKADENVCLVCCMPAYWLLALRVKVRTQYNIEGSICEDACCMCCCNLCVQCQLKRELDMMGH